MSGRESTERVLTDEERARDLLEKLKGVHAVDVARDMALGLVNFSSPKLGLTDETRALRDLEDVRVSIELLRAVVGVLDAETGQQAHDLHDALAQLQLAYAHTVQLANAERAAGAAEVPGAAEAPGAGKPGAGERDAAAAAPQAEEAPETPTEAREEAAAEAAGPEAAAGRSRAAGPSAKKPAAAKKKPARASADKAAAKKKPAAKRTSPSKKKPADES